MTVNLETVHLDYGSHSDPEDGHCLLEVVSMLAGQPFNDQPPCVSPVLRAYGTALNDRWNDEQRQKLLPYAPRMLNTAGDGQDQARAFLAFDWLIRVFTPAWLELAGLTDSATALRALHPINGIAAAQAARGVVETAQTNAAAGWEAAWAAAGDAARAAAWAAAGAAAWAAAGAAAWAAAGEAPGAAAGAAAWAAAGAAAWAPAGEAAWAPAGEAAWAAARAAAWAAAGDAARAAGGEAAKDALQPTVEQLQASALDLFDRMINPAPAS